MAQQQFLTCLSGSASPLQLMARQNPSQCYASPPARPFGLRAVCAQLPSSTHPV